MSQSHWYVITGAFSSGKTTVIQGLTAAGYKTIPEVARMIIDESVAQGKTIEEIRADQAAFQRRITEIKLEIEASLPLDEVIFLDRAVPDSIAYYRLMGHEASEAIMVSQKNLYRRIFCLEPLAFVKDYARTEGVETMTQLHSLIQEAYLHLGYEVVLVPAMPAKIAYISFWIEYSHILVRRTNIRFFYLIFTSCDVKLEIKKLTPHTRSKPNGSHASV